MKHVLFSIIVTSFFTFSYSQSDNNSYEQWRLLITKGDNALKEKRLDSAKVYYLKAKDLSNNDLKDHPAYILSLGRLISNSSQLQLEDYTNGFITDIALRTNAIFGDSHPFSIYVKDSLLDSKAYVSGKKNLANSYYNQLDSLFETMDKKAETITPFAKELALYCFMVGENQNSVYYFYYWEPHKNTGYDSYKNIHILSNLNKANELFNANLSEEAESYLISAYNIMDTEMILKEAHGFQIQDKLFHYYRNQKDYKNASYYGLYLDDYYKNKFGEESNEYVYILNELGYSQEMQKNDEFAFPYYSLAKIIIINNLDKDYTAYDAVKANYINSLQIQNKSDEILEFYKEEIQLFNVSKIYNEKYLKALSAYKEIANTNNDYIEHARIINLEIDYYHNETLYENGFINTVFELAGLYKYNSENKIAYQIIEKNITKLKLALKNSDYNAGEFYRSLAVFENSAPSLDKVNSNN